MARSLDQIVAELDTTYKPQIQSIESRRALIDPQIAEEEKGLGAKQTQAFEDILGGARRRGLGFSGIPLSEQAKYTSTEYLPALARLRQQGNEQKLSLQDAILGIRERRDTLAQQLRQQEQDREEQQRQFNLNYQLQKEQQAAQERASRASSGGGGFSPSYGGGGGGVPAPKASVQRRKDGGFNFQDANGRPLSAAGYAAATGQDVRAVLKMMGQAGDKYAGEVYNQLRLDVGFGKDPKRTDYAKKTYAPIFWGT